MRRAERRGLVGNLGRLSVQACLEPIPQAEGGKAEESALDRQSRVDYMADLIAELRTMAAQMQLDMLERLLDLAEDEALRAARVLATTPCKRDTL